MPTYAHSLTVTKISHEPQRVVSISSPPGSDIKRIAVRSAHTPLLFFRRFGRWAGIMFDQVFTPRVPLVLEVETGSVTPPVATMLRDERDPGAASFAAANGEPRPFPARTFAARHPPLRALEFASLGAADGDEHIAAQFFLELDSKTQRFLMQDRAAWSSDVIMPQVMDRFIRMATGRLLAAFDRRQFAPRSTRPTLAPDELERPILAFMSALLRSMHERHLVGMSNRDLCAAAIYAYGCFGCGRLLLDIQPTPALKDRALPDYCSNGGPNGPFIFLFPEFAAAALEHDLDGAFWTQVLPGMVAACELYLLCYGTFVNGELQPESESSYNRRHPRRQATPQLSERLFSAYRSFTPEQCNDRLNELIRTAFICGGVQSRRMSDAHAPTRITTSEAWFAELSEDPAAAPILPLEMSIPLRV